MAEYWRDLEIGEKKKVGDRFWDDGSWVFITDKHLALEFCRTYTVCSKLTQRKAQCVPPIENGKNRYGVDVGYFRKTINRELNCSLNDFKPDELARVLARLSITADNSVVFEDEFKVQKEL